LNLFTDIYSGFFEEQEWSNSVNLTKQEWMQHAAKNFTLAETLYFKVYQRLESLDGMWQKRMEVSIVDPGFSKSLVSF
jgi:hypothetical protein